MIGTGWRRHNRGHILECGAQCTGGNCQVDWKSIPDLWDIGYPIVEAREDGTFSVTKHEGTGGRITVAGIKEQLMYEMGEPEAYITPDCVADFTSLNLEQAGPDLVLVSGVKGRPATEFYKVSVSYSAGYKAVGAIIYSWPDAYEKAKAAVAILRRRLDALGLKFDAMLSEFIGAGALHGVMAGEPSPDLPEVLLRVGNAIKHKATIERFCHGTRPAWLEWSAGGLRPGCREGLSRGIVAYWPGLNRSRR